MESGGAPQGTAQTAPHGKILSHATSHFHDFLAAKTIIAKIPQANYCQRDYFCDILVKII